MCLKDSVSVVDTGGVVCELFYSDTKLGQTTITFIGKKDNSVDLIVYDYVVLWLYAGFLSEICFADGTGRCYTYNRYFNDNICATSNNR
jgi:hypothetical protein